MAAKRGPELAVFWGDTRELLSEKERRSVLQAAVLESVHHDEVLLRDPASQRIIVVVSGAGKKNIFCSVCKHDLVRERYGRTCPDFAICLYKGHRKNGAKKKS